MISRIPLIFSRTSWMLRGPRTLAMAAMAVLVACQDRSETTAPDDGSGVAILARMVATKAPPAANRVRLRLSTFPAEPREWVDIPYESGASISLGTVPEGDSFIIDLRAYSHGSGGVADTVWKWFARTEGRAGLDVTWQVAEAVLDTIPQAGAFPRSVPAGQAISLPAGVWYTLDSTDPRMSKTRSTSDGKPFMMPPSARLRVQLRRAVTGTLDTLAGDTLTILGTTTPVKPLLLPPTPSVPAGPLDSLQPISLTDVSQSDSLQYRIWVAGVSDRWRRYGDPIPGGAFTLEVRAWRDGLASETQVVPYTLKQRMDTVVVRPRLEPDSGALAKSDSVRIVSSNGDSLSYRMVGGADSTWRPYKSPLVAGAYTVQARAHRGGRFSEVVAGTFRLDVALLGKPRLMPLDGMFPGDTVHLEVDSGHTLRYALDDTSTWITTGRNAAFALTVSTTVYAYAQDMQGGRSALLSRPISIVQPERVQVGFRRRNADTVWIVLEAGPGDVVKYQLSGGIVVPADTNPIPVPVPLSLEAWSIRGTATSEKTPYTANAQQPDPPILKALGRNLRPSDLIELQPATVGDTIEYRIAPATDWTPATKPFPLPVGDPVVLLSRSVRHGLSAERTDSFVVVDNPRTVQLNGCSPSCNPGTEVTLSSEFGIVRWSRDSSSWSDYSGPIKLDSSSTIFALAISSRPDSTPIFRWPMSVIQPESPNLRVMSYGESKATIDVVAKKLGDVVQVRVGSMTPMGTRFEVPYGDTVHAWTTRGTAASTTIRYVVARLLPPDFLEQVTTPFSPGTWLRFSLPVGALENDFILVAVNEGAWQRTDSIQLSTAGVYSIRARTARPTPGGIVDSSEVTEGLVTIQPLVAPRLQVGADTVFAHNTVFQIANPAVEGEGLFFRVVDTTSGWVLYDHDLGIRMPGGYPTGQGIDLQLLRVRYHALRNDSAITRYRFSFRDMTTPELTPASGTHWQLGKKFGFDAKGCPTCVLSYTLDTGNVNWETVVPGDSLELPLGTHSVRLTKRDPSGLLSDTLKRPLTIVDLRGFVTQEYKTDTTIIRLKIEIGQATACQLPGQNWLHGDEFRITTDGQQVKCRRTTFSTAIAETSFVVRVNPPSVSVLQPAPNPIPTLEAPKPMARSGTFALEGSPWSVALQTPLRVRAAGVRSDRNRRPRMSHFV